MPWKGSDIVLDELEGNRGDTSRIASSLGLSFLIESCIPRKGYVPPAGVGQLITLTPYGKIATDEALGGFSEDTAKVAALRVFYHHNALVDFEKSNVDLVVDHFSNDFNKNELRLPDSFDRILYDQYNSLSWADRFDSISPEQTDLVLQGAEQAVYQVGQMVSGPLGLLRSQEFRFLPPPQSVPLWHCPDPGCNQLHTVNLLKYGSDLQSASRTLQAHLVKEQGPPSEWEAPYFRLLRPHRIGNRRPYADLLPLIASAIIGKERSALLTAALGTPAGVQLRESISKAFGVGDARGSASDVAARRLPFERLQLLALLSNSELVDLIDQTVASGGISVPSTELRRSSVGFDSKYDEKASLSTLGVRSDIVEPAVTLSANIFHAYEDAGLLQDLSWRSQTNDVGPGSALEYMRVHGPREVVRNLILPSQTISTAVASKIFLKLEKSVDTEALIDRFLWKSGFDISRFDNRYVRFRSALANFSETLLSLEVKLNDADREGIRSSGVNVFVYLEDFLEELISYNVWLLSKDHFAITEFRYNRQAAVVAVADVLGDQREVGGNSFKWNRAGGNVLGTLLLFGRAAADWMLALPSQEIANDLRRKEEELPHFAAWPERHFPFRSKELWADCNREALAEFASQFNALFQNLERANLAEVRNGLDHYRDNVRFPNLDTMIACGSRLLSAFDAADVQRFLPKTFWLVQKTQDQFGLTLETLEDYLGRRVTIQWPDVMIGLKNPQFGRPVILPARNLFGPGSAGLLFGINESSEYTIYWNEFPKKGRAFPQRTRSPVGEDAIVSGESAIAALFESERQGSE